MSTLKISHQLTKVEDDIEDDTRARICQESGFLYRYGEYYFSFSYYVYIPYVLNENKT